MMIKIIQNPRKRIKSKIEKMKEMFAKDLQEPKNKETEMNYMLEGINSTITEAEEQISDLRAQNGNHCGKREYRKMNGEKKK